jgi:hypothetical protein
MKKKTKKLVLAKETVRSLGTTDIGKAAGGSRACLSYWCATSNGPYVCGQACPGSACGNTCSC